VIHRIPPVVQRQLKIRVIRRRRLSSLPRYLPCVSFDDRAVALPLDVSLVAVDSWVAGSGVVADVAVDAFLPGAWKPEPEHYEAYDDKTAEDADGDGPGWCHCCGLCCACCGVVERKAGSGVGVELRARDIATAKKLAFVYRDQPERAKANRYGFATRLCVCITAVVTEVKASAERGLYVRFGVLWNAVFAEGSRSHPHVAFASVLQLEATYVFAIRGSNAARPRRAHMC
jgi:hypothetical protein